MRVLPVVLSEYHHTMSDKDQHTRHAPQMLGSPLEGTMSATPATWVDGKRWAWLLSPAFPVIGLIAFSIYAAGGHGVWLFALPIVFYVIAPLADYLLGEDRINAPESAVSHLDADRYYLRIVFAYIPPQYLVTVLGAWIATQMPLAWWEMLGVILGSGVANGIGINTAHELGHKASGIERWLAKIALAPVGYGHFFIEHNKGHHKNVATPEDPASSRMGETFYEFLPRTIIGTFRSAWAIEAGRLNRLGKSVWSVENENLQSWAMTAVLFGALTAWLGWWALPFLIVQAAFGYTILEVVNYLEHYGLLRQKLADGRYERCQPRHSWNSNHVVTNLFLYQLQRHSDHHANPTRRYQALRHFKESPQLPSGYGAMILIAYVPWLWFRIMDPKVVAHHDGDLSRAHLFEPKRAALLKKWSGGVAVAKSASLIDVGPLPAASAVDDKASARRHQCPGCTYIYDEATGCEHEGYAPGTRWAALPMSWQCPQCAVREKPDFVALDE
jgi:alkane 1-monooxygenase